jgi:heterodisulfide reductase subunit A-like polyferredoxin
VIGGPGVSAIANRLPGVTVIVTDKCAGCGTCTKNLCIFNAIQLVDKKAIINQDCRGCGRCVAVCPQKAIKITFDDEQYITKVIEQIDELVDVT